jgi:hypothetical protein
LATNGIFPIFDAANSQSGRDVRRSGHLPRLPGHAEDAESGRAAECGRLPASWLSDSHALNRLVFQHLDHIIQVATRVVGGDFETQIQVGSRDEIGSFEQLFEQFRSVFVDLLASVPHFEEKR